MFLVDIGNSRIKWGYAENGQLHHRGELAYDSRSLESQLGEAWAELPKSDKAFIASVGTPKALKSIRDWLGRQWMSKAQVVKSTASACKVSNAYMEPERLGVDRWLAIIAAYSKQKRAVCVIDCGTAITIDVVSHNGEHLGGLIIPGIEMMRNSLVKGTTGIKLQKAQPAEVSLLARDTEGAVIGGTLYTSIAVIDRVVSDITETLGRNIAYVITGGDAANLLPLLQHQYISEPDLVLQGLALVATEN
jgi:type III pantothenate kinase